MNPTETCEFLRARNADLQAEVARLTAENLALRFGGDLRGPGLSRGPTAPTPSDISKKDFESRLFDFLDEEEPESLDSIREELSECGIDVNAQTSWVKQYVKQQAGDVDE